MATLDRRFPRGALAVDARRPRSPDALTQPVSARGRVLRGLRRKPLSTRNMLRVVTSLDDAALDGVLDELVHMRRVQRIAVIDPTSDERDDRFRLVPPRATDSVGELDRLPAPLPSAA